MHRSLADVANVVHADVIAEKRCQLAFCNREAFENALAVEQDVFVPPRWWILFHVVEKASLEGVAGRMAFPARTPLARLHLVQENQHLQQSEDVSDGLETVVLQENVPLHGKSGELPFTSFTRSVRYDILFVVWAPWW